MSATERMSNAITANVLVRLVKKLHGSSAVMHGHEVEICSKVGEHIATDVGNLKLKTIVNDDVVNDDLIMKINPGIKKTLYMNSFTDTLFMKEGTFYTEILPLINKELLAIGEPELRTPKCHMLDLTKGSQVLILQNMKALGYDTLDRKEPLPRDHLKMVLEELARLHASSFIVQKKHSVDNKAFEEIYSRFLDDKDSDIFREAFEHYAGLANQYDFNKVALVLHALKIEARQFFRELLTSKDKFRVFLHGESWIPNMLFKKDGELDGCVLIDFQMIRKGSLVLDLNHLFYTCLDGESRNEYLSTNLDDYYKKFTNVLKKAGIAEPFTRKELEQEYLNKNMFGFMIMIDTLYKVKCEDKDCLQVTDFLQDEVKAIEARRRAYVMSRMDLMGPRLLAVFKEMSLNAKFRK